MEHDSEYYREQIELRDQIKKNSAAFLSLKRKISDLKISISSNEEFIINKQKELSELRNKSKRFLFWRKKTGEEENEKFLEARILYYKQENDNLRKELEKTSKQFDELQHLLATQKELYSLELGEGINLIDGVVTINDKAEVGNIPVDESKEVIIHCTDFFPKDKTILCNYDGNKEFYGDISYKGVPKRVDYVSHRHSCHFTINRVVQSTSDGAGKWEQPKYIIVEPLKPHKNQFVSTNSSDAWTYGSVKLGDNSVLLVREDEYENIPKEELEKFSVFKYSGKYTECLYRLLQLFGVKKKIGDINNAGHAHSFEMALEESMNYRNLAVNYIKDNSWDGKEDISLSEDELFSLFEISQKYKSNAYTAMSEELSLRMEQITGIPENFIRFMICFGLQKKGDNYVLKGDDLLYYELKRFHSYTGDNLDERVDKAFQFYDFNEMKKLFEKYCDFQQKQSNQSLNLDGLSIRCKELYKFENVDFARIVVDRIIPMIHKKTHFTLTRNGCLIEETLSLADYNFDELENVDLEIKNDEEVEVYTELKADTVQELLDKISQLMSAIDSAKIKKDIIDNNSISK